MTHRVSRIHIVRLLCVPKQFERLTPPALNVHCKMPWDSHRKIGLQRLKCARE